jgi:aerobic-type carbon monoxide dehydrogenase small subunit (CoxS/CutS family)
MGMSEISDERPLAEVSVVVNGERITTTVEPRLKLADFLRTYLDLAGVRVGCEHGVCGACTVEVDGNIIKSCLRYTVQVDGQEIETVEALADESGLHPVQEAFHSEHALQCGFCTSGLVMATADLLAENPDPSRAEIREGLAGNICRCTGYQNILSAVETAAEAYPEGE